MHYQGDVKVYSGDNSISVENVSGNKVYDPGME